MVPWSKQVMGQKHCRGRRDLRWVRNPRESPPSQNEKQSQARTTTQGAHLHPHGEPRARTLSFYMTVTSARAYKCSHRLSEAAKSFSH